MRQIKVKQETYQQALEKGFPKYASIFHRLLKISSPPTQFMMQKWLRDIFNIHILKQPFFSSKYNTTSYRAFAIRVSDGKVVRSEELNSYELLKKV